MSTYKPAKTLDEQIKYCYEVTFVKTKLHSYFINIQF